MKFLRTAWHWLRMYNAPGDALRGLDPSCFSPAWIGVLVCSGLIGAAAAGVWYTTYWLMGWSENCFPLVGLVTGSVLLMGPYRRAAVSLSRCIGRDDGVRVLSTALMAIALVFFLMLLRSDWYRQEAAWPAWIAWTRPQSKVVRVLLIANLWGGWAMLVLPNLLRRRIGGCPLTASLIRGCGPFTCAIVMAILLVLSIGWFGYMSWSQLSIAVGAALTATLGGVLLALRANAADRDTALATNLLTQMVVLFLYHINRNVELW